MTMQFDSTGIELTESKYSILPEGKYRLRIIKAYETHSKKGYPQVVVDFEVVEGQGYDKKQIRYHNVTFLPKGASGAGMAIHFVKCIGEPYEGKFDICAAHWIDKEVIAYVKQEKSLKGADINVVKGIDPTPEMIKNDKSKTAPF